GEVHDPRRPARRGRLSAGRVRRRGRDRRRERDERAGDRGRHARRPRSVIAISRFDRRVSRGVCLALAAAAVTGCHGAGGVDEVSLDDRSTKGPRVLAVLAHLDDEIAFGGTLYRTATHLDGACDVLTITNAEGGYKYSTLAEPLYGLDLTDE